MSISFEKTFASDAPAEVQLISPDGKILLIAVLALLVITAGFMTLLPAAPGGDIAASLPPFGL
jgi:hypothetical protein